MGQIWRYGALWGSYGAEMVLWGAEMEDSGNGWRMNGGYGVMGRYGAL